MHCTSCGSEIPEGVKFCGSCGKPSGQAMQQGPVQQAQPVCQPIKQVQPAQQTVQQTNNQQVVHQVTGGEEQKPSSDSKYAVMSVGGYMGSMFVMGIPVIGWLIAIIWACGGSKKVNRRNLARATIIFTIIIFGIFALIGFAINSLVKMAWKGISEASGIDTNSFSIGSIMESVTGGSLEGFDFSQLGNFQGMDTENGEI